LIDPPADKFHFGIAQGWLSIRRHKVIVVVGQGDPEIKLTVIAVPLSNGIAGVSSLQEPLVGLHIELTLFLIRIVAGITVLLKDVVDDVPIQDQLVGRCHDDLFFNLQSEEGPQGIGHVFCQIVLAVGDRSSVVTCDK
jgi:hypothetical protein